MNDNDIKKLGRAELLEILINQAKEIENLRARLSDAEKQLSDRRIILENSGSIAEASLKLSGIFQIAQAAADEYLENIKRHSESREAIFARTEAEAMETAQRIIADAERKAQFREEETEKKCEAMLRVARKASEEYWTAVSAKRENQLRNIMASAEVKDEV